MIWFGYRSVGPHPALCTAVAMAFMSLTGSYEKAVLSVQLCGLAMVASFLIGPSLGVLGHDRAGILEAVGRGAKGFAPAERVCLCDGGGGGQGTNALSAIVLAVCLVRVSDAIAREDAAAIALVFITG